MRILLFYVLLGAGVLASAQSPLTSNFTNYHLVDRFEIMNGEISKFHFTSVKPFRRDMQYRFAAEATAISAVDSFNRAYLLIDNAMYSKSEAALTDKPLLNTFYTRKNAFYSISYEDVLFGTSIDLEVNPVLGFSGGLDVQNDQSIYRNSRGVVVRGNLGRKLGFYTYAMENQYRFPNYLRSQIDETGVVPGTGLHKRFGDNGEDFFNASGYITFSPIKEVMVQFGHDRNFIGNGHRSLILSDYAKEYPFLKFNTRVWRINYMNLFSEHIDYVPTPDGQAFKRKFNAFHHLSINIGKNLNIGFFENVIFDRQDSSENNRYEINYLNPIIFYRSVEHGLNSSDNVILGTDWKWNFLKRFSFYGQLVFDEFQKNEFFKQTSSWTNKWAYQLGLKYINVAGINNLDFQYEYNQVRPYVYQHFTKSQNWIHFNQALAHPLGANFRENIVIIRYQPLDRLNITLLSSISNQGKDSSVNSENYGANILRDYSDIPNKENVQILQGFNSTIQTINFTASYMLWHNLFIDFQLLYRTTSGSYYTAPMNNLIIGGGLRLNTGLRKYE
ncbi:hypothetical protein GYB22_00245 [bacterium]|nr:hypothetical protein [bacterium]